MKKALFSKSARQAVFVAVAVLTFQSCVKDNFDTKKIAEVKWNPNFAVPLAYTTLNMDDLLKESKDFIKTGSDGMLTLVYKDEITSLTASSISSFDLPNQSPTSTVISTGSISGSILNGNSRTASNTQTMTFITSVASSKIDKVYFKAGLMGFSVSSDIQANIDVTIVIPSAKKDGVSFSKTITLNYTGTPPVTTSTNYDLTGYVFDMTQGGTSHSHFDVNYTVKVYGPVTLSGAEQVEVTATMNNLGYSKIVGNVGDHKIVGQTDTIDLTLFKNALGAASFSLEEPKVIMNTHNSFGLPVSVQLTKLSGDTPGSTPYQIPNSLPLIVPMAFPLLSQEGQTLSASDSLTIGNSKIKEVFNHTPKHIVYSLNAQTDAINASQSNFILDTSKFAMDLEVAIPLHGSISDFVLVDTSEFSIGENITDNLGSGVLRVISTNGFPIDVKMQIYFVDSLYNRIDSLMESERPILASAITSSGKVITPTTIYKDIAIDNTKLKKLGTTKYIVIKAAVSTENSGNTPVKIYSDYVIDIKLGLQVQIDAKFKPNN